MDTLYKPVTRGRKPQARLADTALNAGDTRYRAPALDKGLDILELLARQPHGLTRAEIVKEMARSASEIYRMLERLVARQYVVRSMGGDRYALSLKLFALSNMHPPLSRLIGEALPVMDRFTQSAEQSCHLGVYDRGSVLIIAKINSPSGWGFSLQRGARMGLLDTAAGHVLLAFNDVDTVRRMRSEHQAVDGEVPMAEERLQSTLERIRLQGYMQCDSLQSYGVVDMAVPILGPGNTTSAVLACPYIRRVDQHVGPEVDRVLAYLQQAAQALSLVQ